MTPMSQRTCGWGPALVRTLTTLLNHRLPRIEVGDLERSHRVCPETEPKLHELHELIRFFQVV